jgi:hypothetical protein
VAVDFDKGARRAQQLGIDVQQVGQSLAHHLSEARQKVRDNPRLLERAVEADNIAVTEKSGATRVTWETLGGLPEGFAPITVYASTREAVLNKTTLRELLERRYKREFAWAMARAGMFEDSLEGRRAAMRRAIAASVYVADLDLMGSAS